MATTIPTDLAQRLEVYRAMDEPHPQCASIVEDLATEGLLGHNLSDETHGSLVSHLIAALGRNLTGDDTLEDPPAASFAEVETNFPTAIDEAETVCHFLATKHNLDLPESEKKYISIHLAAIALAQKTKES